MTRPNCDENELGDGSRAQLLENYIKRPIISDSGPTLASHAFFPSSACFYALKSFECRGNLLQDNWRWR